MIFLRSQPTSSKSHTSADLARETARALSVSSFVGKRDRCTCQSSVLVEEKKALDCKCTLETIIYLKRACGWASLISLHPPQSIGSAKAFTRSLLSTLAAIHLPYQSHSTTKTTTQECCIFVAAVVALIYRNRGLEGRKPRAA